MNKVIQYVKDSYGELKNHVSWTPLTELQNSTAVVIVGLVIITLIILVMDKICELGIVDGVYGNL